MNFNHKAVAVVVGYYFTNEGNLLLLAVASTPSC